MKATTILNKFLPNVTPNMHSVRRKSLNAMLHSLMLGADLSVTGLGRNIISRTSEKKRSMRLCSNPHLHAEINAIYSFMAQGLIGSQTQPIILVDWSDLDPRKQHFLLRASVAIEGRSLTLLKEIYPLSHKEKPTVHKRFMAKLKTFLPENCKPIIVTDAGFRVPWFKMVKSLGWDYVGRVRNRTFCKNETDEEWHSIKDLYATASTKERCLGSYQLCRNSPITCQFVIYKSKAKGRHHFTAIGDKPRQGKPSRVHAEREKEPWLLATSLDLQSGVKSYKMVSGLAFCTKWCQVLPFASLRAGTLI